jgi:hypothetical protein
MATVGKATASCGVSCSRLLSGVPVRQDERIGVGTVLWGERRGGECGAGAGAGAGATILPLRGRRGRSARFPGRLPALREQGLELGGLDPAALAAVFELEVAGGHGEARRAAVSRHICWIWFRPGRLFGSATGF